MRGCFSLAWHRCCCRTAALPSPCAIAIPSFISLRFADVPWRAWSVGAALCPLALLSPPRASLNYSLLCGRPCPLLHRWYSLWFGHHGSSFGWSLSCCCSSLFLRHGCTLFSHRIAYHPSLKVCCMDLDLEPGESLTRPPSVLTMAAFVNVVFLARGVVILVQNPFCMQGESLVCSFVGDGRWRCSRHSLLSGIVLHGILTRPSLASRFWASGDGACALGVFVVQ
jgi:hypothetical protein